MGVEPINKVVQAWEQKRITPTQAIGKNILLTQTLYQNQNFDPTLHQETTQKVEELIKQLATLQTTHKATQKTQSQIFDDILEIGQTLITLTTTQRS